MKIAVLVSGGVDSSVALSLLKEEGHDLTAFYLKIWLEDELSFLGSCPWEEDLHYVEQVCTALGVPLQVLSLQKEYREQIVGYVLTEIKRGRTPNPDILCNERIKFGLFFSHIGAEFEKVATGHYAQVVHHNGAYILRCAPDEVKDQTYFLARLSQLQLARACFPIGHMTKAQVREIALRLSLPNAARKDSQGICFLGKIKFPEFIKHYCGERVGEIREFETGLILGHHRGYWFHTVGQRYGLRLAGGPWYVVKKEADSNEVFVSRRYEGIELGNRQFTVTALNWLRLPDERMPLRVKLRHGAASHGCLYDGDPRGENLAIVLEQRDQGVAPGQFAVFYQGPWCIGSGVITHNSW